MIIDPSGPSKGDYRVIAGLRNVPAIYFAPHPFYDYNKRNTAPASLFDPSRSAAQADFNWRFAHSLKTGDNPGWGTVGWYDYTGSFGNNFLIPWVGGQARKSAYTGSLVDTLKSVLPTRIPAYGASSFPAVPAGTLGAKLNQNGTSYDGDWDTGQGALEDGPYINKPDEGNAALAFPPASSSNQSNYARTNRDTSVYYSRSPADIDRGVTYSPNREVSSAVVFGSLPSGIDPALASSTTNASAKPWQTLLFCAYPAAAASGTFHHPGFGISSNTSSGGAYAPPSPPYLKIPDHYLLDLFTMPIVEPYAISEPLSSQGKVNMNYQIAPFTYIRRDTGVRAVLKGTRMMAIPATKAALAGYKSAGGNLSTQYRYPIWADETTGTLRAFEDRFNSGDIFRSASEICSVPLVPDNVASSDGTQSFDSSVTSYLKDYTKIANFWNVCKLTGDNAREEPYGDLYPRLTTKSNTYTIHVRVQTLKKALATDPATFVDPADTSTGSTKDVVTAEYRGSFQIERYVDPNAGATNNNDPTTPTFPDYATNTAAATTTPISKFYKFHTIGTKDF